MLVLDVVPLKMKQQSKHLEIGTNKVRDLDAKHLDHYIALLEDGSVLTHEHQIKIKHQFQFPLIRILNKDQFIVANVRTEKNNNAFIYNFYGQCIQSFFAGDGIQDVVVQGEKIIFTYFDEGVCGSDGPNNDGLAVFDFMGKQIFGFNSSAVSGQILDCYCICKHEANKVLFYPYDEFKVFELDLDSLEVVSFKTPRDFEGASAMSSVEDKIVFHSSYDSKSSFFLWDRNKSKVTKFGRCSTGVKGMKDGKFLRFGEQSFTIIDPLTEVL